MRWSDPIKYLKKPLGIVGAVSVAFGTAVTVISFYQPPPWTTGLIRYAGAVAFFFALVYLAYELGRFKESLSSNEATAAVTRCCQYVRFEPHGEFEFDLDLVNRLARSQWLRSNHPQWSVSRIDADNGHIFAPEGWALILPGLVFSITRLGTNTSSRYRVTREDISPDETRLTPNQFQVRAADKPSDFLVDVLDPSEEDVGRGFDRERFIAGIFGALNER